MHTTDLYSFWGAISTRIGAVLLITFGVQILINLYKYNMRMSAFYDSIADAIELNPKLDKNFYKLLKALSPNKIDFGPGVKSPSTEVIELAKAAMKIKSKDE
jgi:hypothetical protein